MNKKHVCCSGKWVFPFALVPSPTIRGAWRYSGLSLTAPVSYTIKSMKNSTYHELRLTYTQDNAHQESGCYDWFLGRCARRCTNTAARPQKVFLSFKSCNHPAAPGPWPALYLGTRSIVSCRWPNHASAQIEPLQRVTPLYRDNV